MTSASCELADLGVLGIRGPDALRFLQGQLSNDVAHLAPGGALLAGLHNPQGRTLALLRIGMPRPEVVLAVLPVDLAAALVAQLRKFVLRSKVAILDERTEWRVLGITGSAAAATSHELVLPLGTTPARALAVLPVATGGGAARSPDAPLSRDAWRTLDIEAGLPQVYAATSGAFVAQMLNLDVLGAVAFDKGCYTGQEVIARAHYRGRIKRRMQRFRSRGPVTLAPGATGRMTDGRTYQVVDAVMQADGRAHFLAVSPVAAADETSVAPAGSDALLDCESLPLPYALPA
ncbi:MAG: hypothetical protein WCE48_10650 [Steroidobacteraceae bacterium]